MSKKNNKDKEMQQEAEKMENEVEAEETPVTEGTEKAEEAAGPQTSKKENKKLKEAQEKVEQLTKEVEELKASVAKEKNDYLRLMADFENFRRHSAEAKLELVGTASAETIKGLLPVLDDCERAIKMLSESKDEVALEGTELIYNKLLGYLKTKGLEKIEALGEKFDTDFHEAVAQFPVQEEEKKGLVFDVVQTGYTLSGKVIRYAKVVVGI